MPIGSTNPRDSLERSNREGTPDHSVGWREAPRRLEPKWRLCLVWTRAL